MEIPGKEGKFKETTSIHQKYSNRPEYLENMCLAQFSMMYESIPPYNVKKITFIDGIENLNSIHKIFSWNMNEEIHMPAYI